MNAEQEKILNLLYDEPYKIGHFTGFKDLTVLHNEWLKSFLYGEDMLKNQYGQYLLKVIVEMKETGNPNLD